MCKEWQYLGIAIAVGRVDDIHVFIDDLDHLNVVVGKG
jgi:hypothetical protein